MRANWLLRVSLAPNIGFCQYFSWSPLRKIVAAIFINFLWIFKVCKIGLICVHQWVSTEEKRRMGWVGLWHHFRNNMFLLQSRYRMQERCVVGGCSNTGCLGESIPLYLIPLSQQNPTRSVKKTKEVGQPAKS